MDAIYLSHEKFDPKRRCILFLYNSQTEYIYNDYLQYHDFYEIQLYQSSTQNAEEVLAVLTLENEQYPIYHNCLVFINMFEQHKIEIINNNYTRFCFDISPDFIHFASSAESNLLNIFSRNSPHYPMRVLNLEQSNHIIELFHNFHKHDITNGCDVFEKGILCIFLAHLFDICYEDFRPNTTREDKHIALVFQIIQYIDTHIENPLSLKELSDALHFSTYYLCHSFKKYTNISLGKYILDKKIELAKQLLSVYPVTAVSEKIGFNSYSSFFRMFKKHTGVSPSDFKNTRKP